MKNVIKYYNQNFNKEVINQIKNSNLLEYIKKELILNKGYNKEVIYKGIYKGFYIFEAEPQNESFALNYKYYLETNLQLNSYHGIDELLSRIDDITILK